ncbi:MAG: sulfotransferase, partial [Acidobacteriota bacterium]
FYRNQLQLLSWRHEPARWLLKSPAHMPFLDRLLDVFDDACVVQTHRDPAQVLGSSCSLAAAASRPLVNRLDLHQVGASVLVRAEQAMSRLERMRDRIEPGRVCDVRYDDLVADPVGTVRRIHAHFDLDLPADMADRMRRWLADHPRHKHGRHRYSLEQFGLDRHEVDAVFAPYVRRFGLRGDVSASTVSDRPVPLEAPAPRPGP